MTDEEIKKLNQLEDDTRKQILEDYENNILIEALAGAGKTTILITRLIEQVKSIAPSKIVAITFTEKAADELKGRFQKKLLEEYNKATEEDKTKLQNAVDHINDIQISTIHSFCNKLLKEMSFEAGLGLDIEVVQDVSENEYIKSFFENFCRADAQKADRERLAKVGINAEQLFSTFREMCKKRDVDKWEYDYELSADPNGLNTTFSKIRSYNILTKIYDCLTSDKTLQDDNEGRIFIVHGFTDSEIETLGSKNGSDQVLKEPVLRIKKYIKQNGNNIDLKAMSIIEEVLDKKGVQSKICVGRKDSNKKYDAALFEKSKETYKEIKNVFNESLIKQVIDIWENYLHAISMNLLVKAYNEYHHNRVSGGRITNDDLLVMTRNMLRDSKKARDFFRKEYQYYYIDEYQDTDPIQTEILQLLTATEDTIDKPLNDTEFMDGRFCLIGDPKQSIYAFRGADVRLYANMRTAITAQKNCKLYQMNRNYRSNDEICTWVNNKFRKDSRSGFGFDTCVNAANSGSSQAGFDNMLSAQPSTNAVNYMKGVYRYKVTGDKKAIIMAEDAKHVAHMIKNMIDAKVKLSIMDTRTGIASDKEVEPGDFMIITRKKDGIRSYATELKTLGIPVLVNGASSISQGDEDDNSSALGAFKKLIILSELVAEPNYKNRAYRLALALAKVFNIEIPPIELFTYYDAIYGEDAQKNLDAITDANLKNALTILTEIIKVSKSNPLLAFEKMAQSYTYLLKKEYTHENLSAEIGALEQIQEQIREAFFGSYRELHEQIKRILLGKNEKELPMGEKESRNAVHIMNAHLAKGLEANIVILACPAYAAPAFMNNVIIEEVKDAATGKLQKKGYVKVCKDSLYTNSYIQSAIGVSNGFEDKAETEKELHAEEEVRLLYVSGTRAKECLIIADTNSDKNKEHVWSSLSKDIGDIDINDVNIPDFKKMISMGVSYPVNCSTVQPSIKIDINSQMSAYDSYRNKKADDINKLISVSELTIRPSDQEKHSNTTSNVDASYMRGNLFGTIMHKFFELLISEEWKKKSLPSFTDEELSVFVRKAVAAGLESERLSPKQCERLLIEESNRNTLITASIEKQQEELSKHMFPELSKLADAIMKDEVFQKDLMSAKVIYTEMPFELGLDAEGIAAIASDIKNGYKEGQAIHVKGTMDLLLELEDSFIIWDYKSDVIKVGESPEEFEKRLQNDYAPQLKIYVEALKNIVASDGDRNNKKIETKLYHRFR